MKPYSKHDLQIEHGDVFYMSSDGYEDQFGGPDGKKFMSKNFKQLLLEIHKLPMKSQKNILEKRFTDWKGNLKQIDDIVVTGFSIK
jgi:serine phosphatase RsbU (regulator of sigma subunit)